MNLMNFSFKRALLYRIKRSGRGGGGRVGTNTFSNLLGFESSSIARGYSTDTWAGMYFHLLR